MIAYISVLFPIKNRLSTLLMKVKACEKSVSRPGKAASLLGYQTFRTCQAIDLSPQFHKQIGLDKPGVRAKGINHPKYSVEAEYACLKRESASS